MRSLVILHGLFGSSRNWQSITKRIATEIPSKPLHALNLRNHGILNNTKPIIGPIESWETLRKDLEEFWINDLDGNDFDLLGHSFVIKNYLNVNNYCIGWPSSHEFSFIRRILNENLYKKINYS